MNPVSDQRLHVCLVCIEFFGDSIFGGFGRATRFIGRELARRGVRVSAVVPRRSSEKRDRYIVDGIEVFQYDPRRPWRGVRLLRSCAADVYHSQDLSTTTLLAQLARPSAIHVITFRDPMDGHDWRIETDYSGQPRFAWAQYRYFIDNPLVSLAVRRADSLHCAARFLEDKCEAIYGEQSRPSFLPTPVDVPARVTKAAKPTVCYVGRWEGRKRVELFFELARACPDIHFIAIGGARDTEQDQRLRRVYGAIPNLEMTGVLDQFESAGLSEALGRSWILVNTSLREGLPTTFVEAAAHRCAILSFSDPDGFATRFGVRSAEGNLATDLRSLVHGDRWRALGEAGHQHVAQTFAADHAMDLHLQLYASLLQRKRQAA